MIGIIAIATTTGIQASQQINWPSINWPAATVMIVGIIVFGAFLITAIKSM
jgi:uncharacterized membrane protein